MRRMYSDGQVVKVVNKAIDDGKIVIEAGGLPEIEAGDAGKALVVNQAEDGAEWATVGLSPEDQEKLDNSLQLPESAPAAQQLVGINTSGEQNAIGIGDGLEITSNTLTNKVKILEVDFNGANTVDITEDLYQKVITGYYEIIICRNHKKSSLKNPAICYNVPLMSSNQSSAPTNAVYRSYGDVVLATGSWVRYFIQKYCSVTANTVSGNRKLSISDGTSGPNYINMISTFSGLSGTKIEPDDRPNAGALNQSYRFFDLDPDNDGTKCEITWKTRNNTYAIGEATKYSSDGTSATKYIIVLNMSTGA